MIFYHFLNREYALEDLVARRIKISDIATLNDPFDFLSVAAPTKADRRLLRDWRNDMAARFGLVCFSRNWHNPVQWAHYADRHLGLCLGFEINDLHLRQVNYVQSRPVWPAAAKPWPPHVKEKLIDQLLYTKFSHWSYEDEYRLFTSKDSPDANGYSYLNFSHNFRLRQVLVGACSSVTRAELNEALAEQANDVETFKVRLAFRDFRIVKQKKASEWR